MTPDSFRAILPAFVNVKDDVIQAQLTLAAGHLDVDRWGDYLDEGTAYWVAHQITIGRADDTVGEGNDVIHRETATLKLARDPVLLGRQARDPFLRTTWGQRYRYLANIVGLGAVAV